MNKSLEEAAAFVVGEPWRNSMSITERKTYLNHIRRLQAENRILRDVLAVERVNRQVIAMRYWQRARSRWRSTLDMLIIGFIETRRVNL